MYCLSNIINEIFKSSKYENIINIIILMKLPKGQYTFFIVLSMFHSHL